MAITDHKLRFVIDADGKAARRELVDIDNMIGRMGAGLGSFAGPAAIAASGVAAIGVAAVAGGAALFTLSKQAAAYGSEIYNASVKTGLSAETISSLKLAADRTGVSLESVGTIISRFSKQIGEAAQGSEEAKEKLTRLGIDPKQAINDLDGALAQAVKRIYEMRSPIERATAAQQLFGKAGTELLKVLDDAKGSLPGLIAEAKRLGVTLTDEDARAADEFGDQLDVLNAQIGSVARKIGQAFMPVFSEMAQSMTEFFSRNSDDIRRWANNSSLTIQGLADSFRDLKVAADNYYFSDAVQLMMKYDPVARHVAAVGDRLRLNAAATNAVQSGALRPDGTIDFAKFLGETKPPRASSSYLDEKPGRSASRKTSSGDNRTDKQVYQAFVKELGKLGVTINSGFRTYAQQAALYAKLPKGQAAVPGTSDHEFYRAVDLPPNVSQALLEKAARAAGVVLEKRNVHQGTGLHNHQAFRKGRSTGGGEAEIIANAEVERKELEELNNLAQQTLDEWIAAEQRASDDRLSIRRKEADVAVAIIDDMVERGQMTELEAARTVGQLKIDMLEEERFELLGQISTKETIQRLEEIRLELDEQHQKNKTEELRIEKAISEEIRKQLDGLQKRNQRPTNLKTRALPGQGTGFQDQLYNAAGRIQNMGDAWEQVGQQATGAFMQMGQGLGAMLDAWVALGDQADVSMQKMLGAVLGGVAAQAATLAIFHVAMGIAALTPWGAAMYGPAPLHFKAAAVWGGIAVGTALVGRAVTGDANKSGGGSSSSGNSIGSNRNRNENLQPSSRRDENTFVSGRDRNPEARFVAAAMEKLVNKLEGMRAGDVLTAGLKQNRGAIGREMVRTLNSNAGVGVKMRKTMGGR